MIRLQLAVALAVVAAAQPKPAPGSASAVPSSVEIAVATRDLAVGQRLEAGDFKLVSVPSALVTISYVKSDSTSYVAGVRVGVPTLRGDFLRWSMFEVAHSDKEARTLDECLKAAKVPGSAAEQVARARQVVLSRKP